VRYSRLPPKRLQATLARICGGAGGRLARRRTRPTDGGKRPLDVTGRHRRLTRNQQPAGALLAVGRQLCRPGQQGRARGVGTVS
jgi:hypothetical protein